MIFLVFRDRVYGVGFGIYNTLRNYFNKKIKKITKHLLKCYKMRRL